MSLSNSKAMDKFQNTMEKYVVPVGMKISNQKHVAAIRDGMMVLIPLTIIGGFSCLLAFPPVPSTLTESTNFFYAFLLAWQKWATANASVLFVPYYLTIGIITLYVVLGISYRLAANYKMDGMSNMCSALLVFMAVSGAFDLKNMTLSVSSLGAGYMFGGIVIALAVVEINHLFMKYNLTIKLPASVPQNVAAPFNVLIPLTFNIVFFMFLNVISIKLTGAGITGLVYKVFQPLLSVTGSLPSVMLINIIMTTFWFFGVHGANMVSVVTTPITTAAIAANLEAYARGDQIPYVFAGMANSVFGNFITYNAILIVIFAACRSAHLRSVAKVAIVPSIFNINEPSIFGLPTVLNVFTYIPLLVCGCLNFAIYYICASAGLIGKFVLNLPFTTPGPIMAFVSTMDIKALFLWGALMVMDIVIVYPFVKMYDKQMLKEESEYVQEV